VTVRFSVTISVTGFRTVLVSMTVSHTVFITWTWRVRCSWTISVFWVMYVSVFISDLYVVRTSSCHSGTMTVRRTVVVHGAAVAAGAAVAGAAAAWGAAVVVPHPPQPVEQALAHGSQQLDPRLNSRPPNACAGAADKPTSPMAAAVSIQTLNRNI
jgi:hypothetical protein